MPTDLEQQLARFAETLDREAPTISSDDIFGRGTVAVDVDLPEPASSERAPRIDVVPSVDTTASPFEVGRSDEPIELGPALATRRPAWRHITFKVALAAAAVLLLVFGLATLERGGDDLDPADVPPTTVPPEPLIPRTSPDGEVTISTPSTWAVSWSGGPRSPNTPPDVWWAVPQDTDPDRPEGHGIGLVDPVALDAWCAEHGGSRLLSGPADAAAITQELIADPNFETTAPVAVRVGGLEAVSIDVALAPGGASCGVGLVTIPRWVHELNPGYHLVPDLRLRLYLVDLPEGMSVDTLAITVLAPEARFEEYLAATAPIIESIEFHPHSKKPT